MKATGLEVGSQSQRAALAGTVQPLVLGEEGSIKDDICSNRTSTAWPLCPSFVRVVLLT